MRQKELKEMIQKALNKSKTSIETLSGNDNPQIIELKNKYHGHVEAFEAVLYALNNDRLFLRLMMD